jgi:hypothetical protein
LDFGSNRAADDNLLGSDLSLVMDLLGHIKPEMARWCAKRSLEAIKDALEGRRAKME